MLNEFGHIRLIDFSFSKELRKDNLTLSFCGSPEYVSPEIIMGTGHNKSTDWWSLGILCFELLYGCPPFYSEDFTKMI